MAATIVQGVGTDLNSKRIVDAWEWFFCTEKFNWVNA